jgi:hypothetical protein
MLSLYYDIAENKTTETIAYFKIGSIQIHTAFVSRAITFGEIGDDITINGLKPNIKPAKFESTIYLTGILHREDGPAWIEELNKQWWVDDRPHRINGPAIEYLGGENEWWINGVHLSPEKERALNIWHENKTRRD